MVASMIEGRFGFVLEHISYNKDDTGILLAQYFFGLH